MNDSILINVYFYFSSDCQRMLTPGSSFIAAPIVHVIKALYRFEPSRRMYKKSRISSQKQQHELDFYQHRLMIRDYVLKNVKQD